VGSELCRFEIGLGLALLAAADFHAESAALASPGVVGLQVKTGYQISRCDMHLKLIGICRILGCIAVLLAGLVVRLEAGSPVFPWHSQHHDQAPVGNVPVQVLGRPATSPVTVLPTKQAYPYGWFGADPSKHVHLHWKRSFGPSKTYTQWTKY